MSNAATDDSELAKVEEAPKAQHSAALMLELTAHRTLAARAVMLDQPRVALVALLHCLVQRLLYDGCGVPVTAVKLVTHALDAGLVGPLGESVKTSKAAAVLADAKNRWGERVPGDQAKLLPWLISLDDAELHDLLAFCVAMTLNDARDIEWDSPLTALASAMSLDMAQWWEATAAGYFSRVTKDTILAAIEGGAGSEAAACIKAGLRDRPSRAPTVRHAEHLRPAVLAWPASPFGVPKVLKGSSVQRAPSAGPASGGGLKT